MKGIEKIRYFPLGRRAVLIKWEGNVQEPLLQNILNAKSAVEKSKKGAIVEVINTYDSLLIKYFSAIKSYEEEVAHLKKILLAASDENKVQRRSFRLPVCYDEKFCLDFEEIAVQKNLTRKEMIRLHTAPLYTVYFTGFLPGFPYLGGLSQELYMERKKSPRKKIPAGAVGIGGKQTGIYPRSSPGGWQLIGNCPVPLFDSTNDPPCLLRAGDCIKFFAVSLGAYQDIKATVEEGSYQLKPEICT